MVRVLILVVLLLSTAHAAHAAVPGRLGVHALRLAPQSDVQEYAEPSWGAGLDADFPIPALAKWTSVGVQVAFVNFNSERFERRDPDTLLRTIQSNSQSLFRFAPGLRIGPHGHGAVQPFVGIHGHLASHSISSTLEIPDDDLSDGVDSTIRQDLDSFRDYGIGWDVTGGVHLNFYDRYGAYGGVSYFQTFGIDKPLGDEEITIDPEFFEIYFGLTITFGFMEQLSE